jgi:hypothetical protein
MGDGGNDVIDCAVPRPSGENQKRLMGGSRRIQFPKGGLMQSGLNTPKLTEEMKKA